MTEQRRRRDVPLADPDVGDDERRRVAAVLESGQLSADAEVRRFENAFADYCGVHHGVATSNGTTALHAALTALGINKGDRVVTTPFSFVATANAVRHAGAEPVFVDVDPATYNLDPDAVERCVRERDDVAAILAVHVYGLPAALHRLREIADRHDVALIEDACQAHGATYDGDPVGSFGDVGCFSFYPTKNVTTGEGGMVVTDREPIARRVARFIDHGRDGHHRHVEVGHNFRMTDVAAAIGRAQLEKLPSYVESRRRNAAHYDATLSTASITLPTSPAPAEHAYNQYTIRSPDRDALRRFLDDRGVDTGVYYPTPIHRQPAYDGVDCRAPQAERAAGEVLSLPVHPLLSERDRRAVTTAVNDFQAND